MVLNDPPPPSGRQAAGIALMGLMILILVLLVGLLAPRISALPVLVQAVIYALIGVGWIVPLRPLLRWMGQR